MQQDNDELRRAYARERQARFRERQHAFAPFLFSHNSSYNTHHHSQPIPHLHQFNNHDIHRMNHNLYSQANIEMRHNPDMSHLYNNLDNLHVDNIPWRSPILDNNFDHWPNRNLRGYLPSQHTSRRLSNPDNFFSHRSPRNLHPSQQPFHGHSQVQTPHYHQQQPSSTAQYYQHQHSSPTQYHQHQHNSSTHFHQHQHSSPSPYHQHQNNSPSQPHQHQQASSSRHHQQSVSQHREHQRSHSQPWDFLHTQQSINSTNEWSSSPYFHHEHAHHSQQNHESPHHFRSSSIEQSEHNFLSQNHHILTHNQANLHTPGASNHNLHNSQRTSSENVHNPHPSYENSSNLPPVEIPTSWDDPPEIDLGHVPEQIDERLSQAGFGNPQGENVDEDGDIDLNQFRQNTENHTSRNHPQEHTNRPLAWGWTEPPGFRPYTMRAPRRCPMCDAILFTGETNSLCCRKGRITLQQPPPPPELLSMFKRATQDHSVQGNELIRSIRLINSNFAFTSLGLNSATRAALNNQGQANEFENRRVHGQDLSPQLMQRIQSILHRSNPLIQQFERVASEITPNRSIRLTDNATNVDQRVYNLPTGDQIAAIWVEGNDPSTTETRDVIIKYRDGNLSRIFELDRKYDPLHYVLLHPNGELGWSPALKEEMELATPMNYYAYRLAFRHEDYSLLHWAGRLFQQYCVDQYVKIETERLLYIILNQKDFCVEQFYGVVDAYQNGVQMGHETGRRIVLPTSFIGGPRDMKAWFQDAMALVQTMGKPNLFITVTCNPEWTEIRNNLLPGQSAQDRPDMVTRVFNARLKKICDELYKDGIFGKTVGRTHVIEFQKRGLPHAHILVILESRYIPRTTEDIDQIVRAEIPNQTTEPYLYQAVSRHMIHGPCEPYNTNAPCMVNGVCSKKFPKAFCPET
ncbi:hypothetical protein MJO28_011723, partial [Puccinia striiformis f. sp. tritici]